MARLQIADQARVGPAQTPSPSATAPRANGGEIAGEQLQRMGQQVERSAQAASTIALDVLERANTVRVNEALNTARRAALDLEYGEDGFRARRGEQALPDAFDGQPLSEAYGIRYDDTVRQIETSLGNDAQRQAFRASAQQLGMSFRQQATAHESGEFLRHEQSVIDGGITLGMDEAATAWDTPERARAALANVRALTIEKVDRFGGLSATEQTAFGNAAVSTGVERLVKAAADAGNLTLAQSYAAEYDDILSATSRTNIAGIITPALEAQQAQSIIDRFTRPGTSGPDGSALAQTPTNRRVAFSIAVGSESNNRQTNAAGGVLTSPVGARGVAQLMPGTATYVANRIGRPELAALSSQPTDAGREANYLLGEAYFNEQVDAFGGDVRKGWAAYNAGPRWVTAAQARAAAAEPGTQQADWFWQLNNDGRTAANRRQTEDYVTKNWSQYQAQQGGGAAAPITEIPLSQVLANADAALGPNANSRVRAQVRAGITANYNLARQEEEQGEAERVEAVQTALIANGGRMDLLSASQRAAIPAGEYDSVVNFAKTISAPSAVETPDALYYELQDDQLLGAMSDTQFLALRAVVSESDWRSAANRRQALRNPSPTRENDPGTLPRESLTRVVDPLLVELGLTPGTKNVEERRRIGSVMRYVDQVVLDAQRAAGGRFNDQQLRDLVIPLFAQETVIRRGLGGTSEAPLLGATASMIRRGGAWPAIEAELAASGNNNPTDTDIEVAYYRRLTTGRR